MNAYSRLIHVVLLAAGLALAAMAISLNGPWLLAETRRLEPWKIPLAWASEVTAFVIFVRYCVGRIVSNQTQVSYGTLRSFGFAVALDVGFSAYETAAERLAHAFAMPAGAQILDGHSFAQPIGHRRYSFTCAYQDQKGVMRRVWFTHLERDLPPAVRAPFDAGQFPIPVAVVYDPASPNRSWLADLPYSSDDRLFDYSAISLLFSGFVAAFLALPGRWMGGWPPPQVAPFLGALFLLNLCGWTQGW